MKHSELVNDRQIADMLCMSVSWVRGQRFKRRHGEQHTLTLDPVMIASVPRYRRSEVIALVNRLTRGRRCFT